MNIKNIAKVSLKPLEWHIFSFGLKLLNTPVAFILR